MNFQLTRYERNFANHNPLGVKMQPELDELSQPVVKFDRDIAAVLENSVFFNAVSYRLTRKYFSTDAEENFDF